MNTQSFSFDVSKQPLATPVLYLGQGDKNGTTIEAAIYDNGAPLALTNYSVRFSMRLPDDVSYYSVNGTVSGNVATIPINEEYAAVFVGQTSVAYIEVFSGTTLICSTNRIDVVVLPSAEANADPSTAYSDEITEATNRANAAAAAAEGVILQSMPTMSTEIKGGAICGDGLKMSGDSVGVDAATNTRIDAITADDNPQGGEAITITGLNHFWANIKQAFAAIVHGHNIGEVDGLQAALDAKQATLNTSTTTAVANIISAKSGITITAANFASYGKVAQLVIDFKYDTAITVPANGNITNVTVGTLVSGKRPVYFEAAHSNGDGAGQQWYGITSGGVITLRALEGTGAQRTIAADTSFTLSATYILA